MAGRDAGERRPVDARRGSGLGREDLARLDGNVDRDRRGASHGEPRIGPVRRHRPDDIDLLHLQYESSNATQVDVERLRRVATRHGLADVEHASVADGAEDDRRRGAAEGARRLPGGTGGRRNRIVVRADHRREMLGAAIQLHEQHAIGARADARGELLAADVNRIAVDALVGLRDGLRRRPGRRRAGPSSW